MNRRAWIIALPLLAALGWAGRAAPQVDDYVRAQEWFTTRATGASVRYGDVTWRPGPALVSKAVPAGESVVLPPGQQAVLVQMQVDAASAMHQLTGCRLAIVDGRGTRWPAIPEPSGNMVRAFSADGDAAGSCDGAGYAATPGQPVNIDTLFLTDRDAPGPYSLRISTRDGRPWAITLPLTTAQGK